jgi:hypothetical protein
MVVVTCCLPMLSKLVSHIVSLLDVYDNGQVLVPFPVSVVSTFGYLPQKILYFVAASKMIIQS